MENNIETFDFSTALNYLKDGKVVQRLGWGNPNITVHVQLPDENSANTEPYLYMVKEPLTPDVKKKRFPLDLSCESIFANDWILVDLK